MFVAGREVKRGHVWPEVRNSHVLLDGYDMTGQDRLCVSCIKSGQREGERETRSE